jgi:hypothetical protein
MILVFFLSIKLHCYIDFTINYDILPHFNTKGLFQMKKILTSCIIALTAFTSGCSFVDIDVLSTEVAYKYKSDINDSTRFNPGSDYFIHFPLEADPRVLYVDYGIKTSKFKANYTLPTKQKISIAVEAEIIYRFKRNPLDKGLNLDFSKDDHVKYFTSSVSPTHNIRDFGLTVSPKNLWDKVMSEPTDLAFRSVFTDAKTYPSFDDVERSIVSIQTSIKEALTTAANLHYIEIIGVKIKDIPVPLPISESRGENLRLTQEAINQVQALRIQARNASMKMAVDVRYAMNEVIIDKLVAGQTDKGYMLMETLRKGVEKGNAMEINITPDFMNYLEKGNEKIGKKDKKLRAELFNKLNKMDDVELMNHFAKGEI